MLLIIASSERESQEVICNPTTPLHIDSGGYLVVITGFSRLQRVIFCHVSGCSGITWISVDVVDNAWISVDVMDMRGSQWM